MTDPRVGRLREAAHDAYHRHNEMCGCRTVGHLTAFICDAVLAADAVEGDQLPIVEWLRGDEAESIARAAEREGVAPEDALAAAIERPGHVETWLEYQERHNR